MYSTSTSISMNNSPVNIINNKETNYNNTKILKNSLNMKKIGYRGITDLKYRRKVSHFKSDRPCQIIINIGNFTEKDNFPFHLLNLSHFEYFPKHFRHEYNDCRRYSFGSKNLTNRYKNGLEHKNQTKVCTYIYKTQRGRLSSMDLTYRDKKTLNNGRYLNDKRINFYLKFIEDNLTNSQNTYILSSYCYNFLKFDTGNFNLEFNSYQSFNPKKHKINIFDFDRVYIPICDNNHWILILIDGLKKMVNIFDEKYNNGEYPEIYYLDSFLQPNTRIIGIIKKYLFYDYQNRIINNPHIVLTQYIPKRQNLINVYYPDIPKQKNSWDCGLYILTYCEFIEYNFEYFIKKAKNNIYKLNYNTSLNPDFPKFELSHNQIYNNEIKIDGLGNWFDQEFLKCKREEISQLIDDLGPVENDEEKRNLIVNNYVERENKRMKNYFV